MYKILHIPTAKYCYWYSYKLCKLDNLVKSISDADYLLNDVFTNYIECNNNQIRLVSARFSKILPIIRHEFEVIEYD